MIIRQAKITDAENIIAFQLAMAKETEQLELNHEILRKGVQAVFNDSAKGIYYVAENNNEILGSLLTTFEWSDWRNGNIIWIQSVYIKPEHRGKKIFSQMYNYIIELANSDENIKGVRLYVDNTNVNAQKVYESLGMNGEHYKLYEWMP